MIDCPNVMVRDALPEYVHDALDPEVAAEIRAHLDGCSMCTAELALMQSVIATTPRIPSIDTTRIVAAIPAYQPTILELPPARSARRTMFESARWRMAAGFLVAAIGVSALSITRHTTTTGKTAATGVSTVAGSNVATSNTDTDGLAIVTVNGLTDDQLMQLTSDLDRVEAAPMDEPESEVPVAMDAEF